MRMPNVSTRLLRRAAAGLATAAATAGLMCVAPAAHATSSVGGPISGAEMMSRAQYWVNQHVPYNQLAYAADPQGRSYREDCSGFVSMAWHLGTSLVVTDPAPYDFTNADGTPNTAYDKGIGSFSNLQQGDAMAYPHEHIWLFDQWTDKANGDFTYYAESNPGDPTHGPTSANINSSTLEGWPRSGYVGLRYNNVTGNAGAHHDFSGDGLDDVVAVNGPTGNLYMYTGDGNGGLNGSKVIGSSWGGMSKVAAGDFNGDGKGDVVAINASDSKMYLYLGNGNGGFSSTGVIGTGWGGMTHIALGDLDGDGKADVLAVNGSDGKLYDYKSTGTGLVSGTAIGSSWGGMTQFAAGDLDGDGKADILAVSGSDGKLYSYRSTGSGVTGMGAIGSSWGGMTQFTMADLNHDGKADVVAVAGSDSKLYFYPSTGSGVGSGIAIGTGWAGMTHVI